MSTPCVPHVLRVHSTLHAKDDFDGSIFNSDEAQVIFMSKTYTMSTI